MASGMKEAHCAEAIGVPQYRFTVWREYTKRPVDWKPKPRSAEKRAVATAITALVPVTVTDDIRVAPGMTLVTPRGYRIEGLTLEQAKELLEVIA